MLWRYLKPRGGEHKRYVCFYPNKSVATWNPHTHLFTIELYIYKTLRADVAKSRKAIYQVMRKYLKAGKHICIVGETNKIRNTEDVYLTPIQFYCKLDELPSEEIMERLPEYIAEALVPIELWRTDKDGNESLINAADLGIKWGTISRCLFENGKYCEEATGARYELL